MEEKENEKENEGLSRIEWNSDHSFVTLHDYHNLDFDS